MAHTFSGGDWPATHSWQQLGLPADGQYQYQYQYQFTAIVRITGDNVRLIEGLTTQVGRLKRDQRS